MNWKSFVEADNARTYVLPAGWDSAEEVAEQLGCSNDSVRRCLAPAIKAGVIESQVFPVWDAITKKIVRLTAYRKAQKAEPKK
jgi:predicted ArsR family transcriptional regulator